MCRPHSPPEPAHSEGPRQAVERSDLGGQWVEDRPRSRVLHLLCQHQARLSGGWATRARLSGGRLGHDYQVGVLGTTIRWVPRARLSGGWASRARLSGGRLGYDYRVGIYWRVEGRN